MEEHRISGWKSEFLREFLPLLGIPEFQYQEGKPPPHLRGGNRPQCAAGGRGHPERGREMARSLLPSSQLRLPGHFCLHHSLDFLGHFCLHHSLDFLTEDWPFIQILSHNLPESATSPHGSWPNSGQHSGRFLAAFRQHPVNILSRDT